jgi:hypothetical protein
MRVLLVVLMLSLSQQAIAFKQAPMGLKWGMMKEDVPGGVFDIENEGGFSVTIAKYPENLPKIMDVQKVVMIFEGAKGLQKINIVFATLNGDVNGQMSLRVYSELKRILTQKYGEPTSREYKNLKGFTSSDEFYECLKLPGCGRISSVFESENVRVLLKIKGIGHGSGYITLSYENDVYTRDLELFKKREREKYESLL